MSDTGVDTRACARVAVVSSKVRTARHACRSRTRRGRGPARGGACLRILVAFFSDMRAVPIAVALSVHGLPRRHGSIELGESYRTSYGRPPEHQGVAVGMYQALPIWRTERTPSPSCMNIMHRARDPRLSMEPFVAAGFNTALVRSPATRLAQLIPTHPLALLALVVLDRVLCRIRIDEPRGLAACWKLPTVVVDRVPPMCAAAAAWSGAESARRAPSGCCTGCGCWRWPRWSASSAG